MSIDNTDFYFQQIHIDVARNATDDFNLFHDPYKWHRIKNNPFAGSIALGFQLESLVENRISHFRTQNDEQKIIANNKLHFSNYQFTFANAVKPGQKVTIQIKKSQLKNSNKNRILSNRIIVKTDDSLALMGYKKESNQALFLEGTYFSSLGNLKDLPDRSYIPVYNFF